MASTLRQVVAAACVACLLSLATPARALVVLSYHDVRDDVAPKGDPDLYAVSTANLAAQFDWLHAHGYVPVSVQAVIDARAGRTRLPDKAVLLTFDDGRRSLYTHVYPLLRAYRFPALAAPVNAWTDLAAGATVRDGTRTLTRDDFATWPQLREMQDSGLVEIGSHTQDLHHGIPGNGYGNLTPAAVTRAWSARGYESDDAYRARIEADLRASVDGIARHVGKRPRVIVWPYAAYNRMSNAIAASLGMTLSFDLEDRSRDQDIGLRDRQPLDQDVAGSLGRLLMYDNPDVADLAHQLRRHPDVVGMRAIQVDLDRVYDPDPAQQARNVDALVQRIHDIHPSHVFLQAFADPDGDGAADALYFPNRHLPMRADLFNRVAWQLRTRADVQVFAWLPVLGFRLPDPAEQSRLQIAASDARDIPRLDPTAPRTRALVSDLYADLARDSYFEGLLFNDDAYLRDDELPALGAGNPDARTRTLIDFTRDLRAAAEQWRPKLVTVRNLFARPVLQPESEAWFAQRLDAFNVAYDYTALMAMPRLERAPRPQRWLRDLVARVAAHPDGIARTVFELQTVDWRTRRPVADDELRAQARLLLAAGARHLAYYPDDVARDQPALPAATEAMSVRAFPYRER